MPLGVSGTQLSLFVWDAFEPDITEKRLMHFKTTLQTFLTVLHNQLEHFDMVWPAPGTNGEQKVTGQWKG